MTKNGIMCTVCAVFYLCVFARGATVTILDQSSATSGPESTEVSMGGTEATYSYETTESAVSTETEPCGRSTDGDQSGPESTEVPTGGTEATYSYETTESAVSTETDPCGRSTAGDQFTTQEESTWTVEATTETREEGPCYVVEFWAMLSVAAALMLTVIALTAFLVLSRGEIKDLKKELDKSRHREKHAEPPTKSPDDDFVVQENSNYYTVDNHQGNRKPEPNGNPFGKSNQEVPHNTFDRQSSFDDLVLQENSTYDSSPSPCADQEIYQNARVSACKSQDPYDIVIVDNSTYHTGP